jgi:hypothetical protein
MAGHARSDQHRAIDRGDYIQRTDLVRAFGQLIATAGTMLGGHQSVAGQLLQHFGHQSR